MWCCIGTKCSDITQSENDWFRPRKSKNITKYRQKIVISIFIGLRDKEETMAVRQ